MHENVPVRFGRGRLDSLATKGLAAYLIAGSWAIHRTTRLVLRLEERQCRLRDRRARGRPTGERDDPR